MSVPNTSLVQRDPAIILSQFYDNIVQCVQTGGAGHLRGNVLSRWGHSSLPVNENGRN